MNNSFKAIETCSCRASVNLELCISYQRESVIYNCIVLWRSLRRKHFIFMCSSDCDIYFSDRNTYGKSIAQPKYIFIELKGLIFICFIEEAGEATGITWKRLCACTQISSAFTPFFVNHRPSIPFIGTTRKKVCKQIAKEISKVIIVNYKMCKILPWITFREDQRENFTGWHCDYWLYDMMCACGVLG